MVLIGHGTGSRSPPNYVGGIACNLIAPRQLIFNIELSSKHYIHLIKVKDKTLRHRIRSHAGADAIIAHIKLY